MGQQKAVSRSPGCNTDERTETRGGCSSPTETLGTNLQHSPGVLQAGQQPSQEHQNNQSQLC